MDHATKVAMLEEDMDDMERIVHEIKQGQSNQNKLLLGILVSVVTGMALYLVQTLLRVAVPTVAGG